MAAVSEKNSVKSVGKVLAILEELARHDGRMRLSALTHSLALPTSTAHRLLKALMARGYVDQDEKTGEYVLGLRLLTLSSVVLKQMNLNQTAYPFLEVLRDKTGETANLVVLDSGEVLYIEKAESRKALRAYSLIGKRAPVHATGAGKVLLADLSTKDIMGIIREKGLGRLTRNTIIDYELFIKELHKVREQEYALDNEECEDGVMCIATPVRNHVGQTIASIGISGPQNRLAEADLEDMITIVQQVGKDLSAKLGFSIP